VFFDKPTGGKAGGAGLYGRLPNWHGGRSSTSDFAAAIAVLCFGSYFGYCNNAGVLTLLVFSIPVNTFTIDSPRTEKTPTSSRPVEVICD